MRNIIQSAALATVVTLAVYFGGVALGLDPRIAAVAAAVAAAAVAFAVATTTAAAAAFAAVAVAPCATFAAAFATGAVAVEAKQAYWKVLIVYLAESAIIAIPIYLHLHGSG